MFRFFLLFLSFSLLSTIYAQDFDKKDQTKGRNIQLLGKVVDDQKKPIFYATVAVYNVNDSSLITGGTTNGKGQFSIETKPGNYYLKINALGWKEKIVANVNLKTTTENLGEIALIRANLNLKEFQVTALQNEVELQLDKKVIRVEDQNTNAGETAVEVLENSPSIQTDQDGNVLLRGSASFTLLINGIPTAMDANNALQTIPASAIKNIEIITNPNAKYDAEGSSGIINIITKKSNLEGLSVLTNLNLGNYENRRGDIALSYGKKSFLFNVGVNAGLNHRPRDIEKIRTTTIDSSISVIKSLGEGAWKVNSYSGNIELQWTPGHHNFMLAGNYTKTKMTPYFYLNIEELYNDVQTSDYVNRQDNIYDMNNTSISFYYNYKIKGEEQHKITFKAINNQHDVDQLDSAMHYSHAGELIGGTKYRETGPSDFVRFNVDYQLPLMDKSFFESGGQVQLGNSADKGKSFFFDSITNVFLFNEQFSAEVDYVRDVYAGYAIFRSEGDKLSYQIGLRGEYTYRKVLSEKFPATVTINRMDWFPSAHLSYNLGSKGQLMVNYSRRIQRPKSWYFEPFVVWETEFNVRSGNTNLTPEYINNFEVNWTKPFEKKGAITIETYFKRTRGVINRVSSVYEENVIITRPFNTGEADFYGIEPAIKYYVTSNWQLSNATNIFLNKLTGEIDDIPYNSTSLNFNNRLTNTISLKNNWKWQLVIKYDSPINTPQGSREGFFTVDASIKKSFAEGKYALNLQGRNLLGTRVNNHIITNQNLHLNRINTPKFPLLKLTFSMRFNNYKKIKSYHEAADEF